MVECGIINVDLSIMVRCPKCAVMCRNIEELTLFYEDVQQQLGQFVYWSFNEILDLYDAYKDKTGFTLFADADEPGSMSYCYEEWFIREGYEIVEFSSLTPSAEIEESDIPVESLFESY